MYTIDFETAAIEARPEYPPKPVGVSIKHNGKRSKYFSWGHPTKNNCTLQQAKKALRAAYNSGEPVLFHNGKFDLDVAHAHMGTPLIPKGGFDDTLFLAFLHNPHAKSLSLKPLCESLLDMPPEEQDAVRDWILTNHPASKGKPKKTWKGWGAFICDVPGDIVGRYAIGDTDRTYKLYNHLIKDIKARDMMGAYEREKKLMPILIKSENDGINIHKSKLEKDLEKFNHDLQACDNYLRNRCKMDFEIDSNEDLAKALDNGGFIDDWEYTEKGNRSVAKDSIERCINNASIRNVLLYRSYLANSVRNFARPWLAMAEKCNGRIHTNWNQVRQANERSGGLQGTRTGRLSSNPNFQNMPKVQPDITLPVGVRKQLQAALPKMREYIAPSPGNVLIGRDYMQQELRMMAYFEQGSLYNAFIENPLMDVHEYAQKMVSSILSQTIDRKPIKIINFGLIYGMGVSKLAAGMGVSETMARRIREAILKIYDGLPALIADMRKVGTTDYPHIRSWGGRCYSPEPPQFYNGRLVDFNYKLLNYLIQGSSADITKQALINYDAIKHDEVRIILQVHDEIVLDVPKKLKDQEMKKLREAMLDVDTGGLLMLSDGAYSSKSWADMRSYRESKKWFEGAQER